MSALAVADLGFGTAMAVRGEPTLDDMVLGAWEALDAHRRSTACLICGGELRPVWNRHEHTLTGSCRDCGAQLS